MITINLGGGGGGGGVEEVAVESAGLSSAFFSSPELQESRKAVMLIPIANGMRNFNCFICLLVLSLKNAGPEEKGRRLVCRM
jgi:hypothetical protein